MTITMSSMVPSDMRTSPVGRTVEFLNLRASSPPQVLVTSYARRSLRDFTRRQCQRHDGSLVAAHPLDLTVELSRKGIDQAAAEPGIRELRIGPLPVV